MIKRLGKAKKRKQGAILVMVVLILALAMIFISMALLLTKATRNRLYENAMSSQARLTVTSAAEVFLEALETQEITDKQIDDYLTECPTRATGKMRMVIADVPGMSATDDTNCTFMNMYYPNKSKMPNTVYVDFSTTIGKQTENVRVELEITPKKNTKSGDRFTNQVDQFTTSAASRLRFEGGIGAVKPGMTVTDNTVLLRNGNDHTTASGGTFYSDMVFGEGAVFDGDQANYFGDFIFLDDAYMTSYTTPKYNIEGDFYFFGSAGVPAFKTGKGEGNGNAMDVWSGLKSKNFVFAGGRTVTNDDYNDAIKNIVKADGASCYFIGEEDGALITASDWEGKNPYTVTNAGKSLPDGDLKDKYAIVSLYDFSSTGKNAFPDDIIDDVFKSMNPDGEVKTAPAGGKTLSYYTYSADGKEFFKAGDKIPEGTEYVVHPLTQYYPSYAMVDGAPKDDKTITMDYNSLKALDKNAKGEYDRVIELKPGYYYLKPGTVLPGKNADDGKEITPYVIAIDGKSGSDYRFYFAPGTFNLMCCVFAVYNADNSKPVIFVLEPGAELKLGVEEQYENTKALCASGFISINRPLSKTGAAGIAEYIQGTSMEEEGYMGEDTKYKYSQYYDNVVKPSIFIFGSSSDTKSTSIEMGSVNSVYEAYIGLYGSNSTFKYHDGHSPVWIYGRIESYSIDNERSSGGKFYMPYCPGPSSSGSPDPDMRPAETKYKVSNITYYYGTGIEEEGGEGEGS
ncbi:MAG: hypothetical protein IKE09_02610 [Clostridiales bacterium]|nr:hypothetical protein [Clostridiales bacterium]